MLTRLWRRLRTAQAPHPAGPRASTILENLPDVIWTADADGRAVYISPRVRDVFGFSQHEVYAHGETLWFDRIHPDDRDAVLEAYRNLFTANELFDVTYRYHHKDDRWVWIHDRALATYDHDGRRYTDGVLNDISALKHAQLAELHMAERLRYAQRLEAIGQLAGGIAHEFNNLLTAVVGYADLIAEDAVHHPEIRESAQQIRKAGDRGAALVQQLMAFGHRQPQARAILDLSRVIDEACAMLQRVIGERVAIRLESTGQPLMVVAERNQIEQMLTNLLLNARDAMPRGGTVVVSMATVDAPSGPLIAPPAAAADRYVRIEVADDGEGMLPATAQRACEPFFTTKDMSRHPGLGLSTVYGIVTQNGGAVSIASEVGKGTRIGIYLPG